MANLRVAVIGVGNMGKNHARIYSELDNVELVAIADANLETKEIASRLRVKHYSDFLKMLNDETIEAVSIAVPTPLHFKTAKAVLEKGVHVLLEKPISSTIEEADELIALAQQKGVVLTVGHIERFNPVVTKLRNLIRSQELGQISSIISTRVGGFPSVQPKTDVILDLAVHDIDIISYLLGERPISVSSHGSRTWHDKEADSAELLLEFKHASGFIRANWITPVKIRTISVTGSKGYVEANYITQKLVHYEHSASKKRLKGFKEFVVAFGEPKRRVSRGKVQEPLRNEISAFTSVVMGRHPEQLLVDPKDAREALAIALQAAKDVARKVMT